MKTVSVWFRICFGLVLLVAVSTMTTNAQTPSPTPAPAASPATPAADPKDVATMDAIVAAVYDVISGPAGRKRNWDRFRSLFVPGARLIPTGRRQTGEVGARVLTPEEYIQRSSPLLEQNGFFEREISRRMERYGSIAHIFSTYESKHKVDDEKPFARGINSIQLMNDGKRWWIVTIYWQNENNQNTLPAEYLRSGRSEPPSNSEVVQLDSRIAKADPAKYLPVVGVWQNPNVFVDINGVYVSSKASVTQKLESANDLGRTLNLLPITAWPLGRVVTFSQSSRIPIQGFKKEVSEDEATSNLKQARIILESMGIDIVYTPIN